MDKLFYTEEIFMKILHDIITIPNFATCPVSSKPIKKINKIRKQCIFFKLMKKYFLTHEQGKEFFKIANVLVNQVFFVCGCFCT